MCILVYNVVNYLLKISFYSRVFWTI